MLPVKSLTGQQGRKANAFVYEHSLGKLILKSTDFELDPCLQNVTQSSKFPNPNVSHQAFNILTTIRLPERIFTALKTEICIIGFS